MAQNDGVSWSWFVAGAIVGAAVALLYAPQTGQETRNLISKKTDEASEALSGTSQDVVEKGKELFDRGKQIADDAAELFERGRKLVRG